jgi:uncharacterized damage-inducible protein DinB
MKAVDLLLMQYKNAHEVLNQVMADVSDNHLHTDPGGTANPVATNLAHVIVCEDYLVNSLFLSKSQLSETTFKDKTGLSSPYPGFSEPEKLTDWMKNAKVSTPEFSEYANAVKQNTEDYIKSLTDEDLDKEIDLKQLGKQTLAFAVNLFIIWNAVAHTGEIAAVKGVHGLKGYPF